MHSYCGALSAAGGGDCCKCGPGLQLLYLRLPLYPFNLLIQMLGPFDEDRLLYHVHNGHDGHSATQTITILILPVFDSRESTHYIHLNPFKTLSVVSHSSLAKSSLLASSLASSRTPYGTKYFPL